jgi:ATP-dependent DNA helicase RecQ
MHIARQLLTMGYLEQEGEYHTLSLTPKALEALRKRATIMGILQESEERVKKAGKTLAPGARAGGKEEMEYNHALFALLRQKRKELADEAGVPPYVIFSDRTLIEMAAYYPRSITSLLTISGVGQVKLRQYGKAFLEVINSYCEKHGLQEHRKEQTREKSDSGRRYVLVAEAYNAGESMASLMERYHVTAGTILEHLTRYLAAGKGLRNGADLESLTPAAPEQREAAFAAFEELSPAFLKPVYDRLNGALTYEDLKILRLLYLISQQVKEN